MFTEAIWCWFKLQNIVVLLFGASFPHALSLSLFLNFLVVFVTFNVSLTVGYRGDTSLRWGGLGADAEECEKVAKEVVAYDYESEHRLDLAMPPNLACRDKLNFFVVEAARLGDVETLKWLLNHAMNPSAEFQGKSAALVALENGKVEVVKFLLDNGAYVHTEDPKTGGTLLHYAALRGYTKLVQTLIGRGAEVDAKNTEGFTPLHEAARTGQADVVKVLLDCGEADINGKAGPGEKTPFDVATPEVKDLLKLKPRS